MGREPDAQDAGEDFWEAMVGDENNNGLFQLRRSLTIKLCSQCWGMKEVGRERESISKTILKTELNKIRNNENVL